MEYRVVVGDSASLPELVNPLLIDGWELQGGISAHTRISSHQTSRSGGFTTVYGEVWAQAMIKKDNRNKTTLTTTDDTVLDNKTLELLQDNSVAKSFGGNSKYRKQRTISSRDIKKQHPRNKRHTRKH
jgi:hypothetical protein